MKKLKTISVPATTKEVLDFFKCELCDNTRNNYRHWPGGEDGSYSVNTTEVQASTGSNYPEGSNITTVSLDICPDCFNTKLIPWFKLLGGEPRTEEEID